MDSCNAFCDGSDGWGVYVNDSQTRHASNGSGNSLPIGLG